MEFAAKCQSSLIPGRNAGYDEVNGV